MSSRFSWLVALLVAFPTVVNAQDSFASLRGGSATIRPENSRGPRFWMLIAESSAPAMRTVGFQSVCRPRLRVSASAGSGSNQPGSCFQRGGASPTR